MISSYLPTHLTITTLSNLYYKKKKKKPEKPNQEKKNQDYKGDICIY